MWVSTIKRKMTNDSKHLCSNLWLNKLSRDRYKATSEMNICDNATQNNTDAMKLDLAKGLQSTICLELWFSITRRNITTDGRHVMF